MPNPFEDFSLHSPPNTQRIEKLYVGLSIDNQGFNGICAAVVPMLGATPMITSSEKVLKIFREQAMWIEQRTGQKVHFFEFIRGKELEDDEA